MVKIKDLGNGQYQTFPETDDMIEVDDLDAWVQMNTPQYVKNLPRINELKQLLTDSDYKAIKFAEGQMTEEEYAPIKAQRQAWRDEINELEESISSENDITE